MRRVLGPFEDWAEILPPNFQPWMHTDSSHPQQGAYPRDGMPRWLAEAPSWPMTHYSFSPDEFDSALGYAIRVMASSKANLLDDAQLCVQMIREHYAYASSAISSGLSV
jgi:hypothetical protein